MKKVTILDLGAMKAEGRKIVMVTAYDALFAQIFDEADVDMILVGDSLGMVVLGYPDTLNVTMEDMIRHTGAVARGRKRAHLVADMPFLSYQTGIPDAVRNAGRLLQAGAESVKLEGGRAMEATIRAITQCDIPVMGHIGLTPQSVNVFGGFTVQAKEAAAAQSLREDAQALQQAGAFAIVLECIPRKLAAEVSAALAIPTIGIGAGAGCDGQVLVLHDLLGLNPDFKPRFVRRFADAAATVRSGAAAYAEAVRAGTFPTDKESF